MLQIPMRAVVVLAVLESGFFGDDLMRSGRWTRNAARALNTKMVAVILLWTLAFASSAHSQVATKDLEEAVSLVIKANESYLAALSTLYLEVSRENDDSILDEKLWINRQNRRYFAERYLDSPLGTVNWGGKKYPFAQRQEQLLDLSTRTVQAFVVLFPDQIDKITPCDQRGFTGGIQPYTSDHDLRPLGATLILLPFDPNSGISLSKFVATYAKEVRLEGDDRVEDSNCKKLRVPARHFLLPDEMIDCEVWVDVERGGLLRRFRATNSMGGTITSVDYVVKNIVEQGSGFFVPSRVECYSRNSDQATPTLRSTLDVKQLIVDSRQWPGGDDEALGFRFPKYARLYRLAEDPWVGNPVKAQEYFVIGDSIDEVLFRYKIAEKEEPGKFQIEMKKWCGDHGFPEPAK